MNAFLAEPVTVVQCRIDVDVFDPFVFVLVDSFLDSVVESPAHCVEIFPNRCRHFDVILAIGLRIRCSRKRDAVAKSSLLVEELSVACDIQFELVSRFALSSFRHNLVNGTTDTSDEVITFDDRPRVSSLVVTCSVLRTAPQVAL